MKEAIKNIVFLFFSTLMFVSCIEEYTPQIEAGESLKYVVNGLLTTQDEDQLITVSLASTIQDPKSIPLNDCVVRIVDFNGNSFVGSEIESGKYKVRIPSQNLNAGTSYQLEIDTPSGAKLVSEYEELLECPEIDSVYFIREDQPTNTEGVYNKGIQFYLNLNARGFENGFFKFEVEETWEYHAERPIEWYFDGQLHEVVPRDWSHKICWSTEEINDIYILNTDELQDNAYKQYPLHFVDNTTQRLLYTYSILVKQYAISEKAYVFWDQLRLNNLEKGGLYEKQPLPVQGNIDNTTNPEQAVLGNFTVTNLKTKRIFIRDVPDLEIRYQHDCGVYLLRKGLRELTPDIYEYPVYVYLDPQGGIYEVTPGCIFCELSGGTLNRPDYWPEQI